MAVNANVQLSQDAAPDHQAAPAAQRDLTPQIDQLDTIVKFLRLTSSVQSRNLMAGILEVVSERIKLVVDEFTATSALYKANLWPLDNDDLNNDQALVENVNDNLALLELLPAIGEVVVENQLRQADRQANLPDREFDELMLTLMGGSYFYPLNDEEQRMVENGFRA